jgi:hypothetical protein
MPRGRQGRGVGSGPSDRQADLAHPGTKGSNIRRRERLSAAPAPEPANYGASYENSSGRESILSRYCYSLLRLAVNASDLPQRSSNPCTWFRITPIFRFHCTRARVSRRPPLFRPGNIAVLPLAGLPAIRQPLRIPVIALASAGRARPFMGWLRCSWKCRSNASPHGPPILRRRFHHHFTDLLICSQAAKAVISFRVVPNSRFSYCGCPSCSRRITTANIFLCTSMPATRRYTVPYVLLVIARRRTGIVMGGCPAAFHCRRTRSVRSGPPCIMLPAVPLRQQPPAVK